MLQVPIASGEPFGEADTLLVASLHDRRDGLRVAAMSAVGAVDHRPMVRAERQQGTDGLHHPSIARPSPHGRRGLGMKYPGDDLFSQEVAPQVSSALESLTSVFGMGTGGAFPPASPG
jgi:hypothetical protein